MKLSLSPFFLLLLVCGSVFGQAQMTTTGNWATAANWSGNNIGDAVTETVSIGNNIDPTIFSGSTYTIGAITFGNTNVLKINSGGTLNVGDATHAVDFTSGNNTTLTVGGTLIIWGDLKINNNIAWNITGTVIIKGNVDMGTNASLTVNGGTLQVGKNFNSGNNATVSVPSGSISVAQNVSVGSNGSLTGCTGCFHTGGTCSGPSTFCTNGVMPITLLSFEGQATGSSIALEWATVSELNFDRFAVERFENNTFIEIGSVPGHGTSNQLIKYSFEDQRPLPGSNYYRLNAIDYDGSFEHSKVIKVDFTSNDEDRVTLYPNPVTDGSFTVLTSFQRNDEDDVRIFDTTGRMVDQSSMTPGIYSLWYISGEKKHIVRFVVK